MIYDKELKLIKETYAPDDEGIQRQQISTTMVLCGEKSVGRTEFYAASTSGLKAENILCMHKFEYDGSQSVEFEGRVLSVLRTFSNGDEIELTVGEIIGK